MLLVTFGVVGLLLAGCSGGGSDAGSTLRDDTQLESGDPSAPELASTTLAAYRQGTVAPVFAAEDIGAFEEADFSIEASYIENSAAGLALVMGGDAEFSYASYWGVVDAINQGVDLVVVADMFGYPEGKLTLEVMPDSEI